MNVFGCILFVSSLGDNICCILELRLVCEKTVIEIIVAVNNKKSLFISFNTFMLFLFQLF